jgi:hypothetical protein
MMLPKAQINVKVLKSKPPFSGGARNLFLGGPLKIYNI